METSPAYYRKLGLSTEINDSKIHYSVMDGVFGALESIPGVVSEDRYLANIKKKMINQNDGFLCSNRWNECKTGPLEYHFFSGNTGTKQSFLCISIRKK